MDRFCVKCRHFRDKGYELGNLLLCDHDEAKPVNRVTGRPEQLTCRDMRYGWFTGSRFIEGPCGKDGILFKAK